MQRFPYIDQALRTGNTLFAKQTEATIQTSHSGLVAHFYTDRLSIAKINQTKMYAQGEVHGEKLWLQEGNNSLSEYIARTPEELFELANTSIQHGIRYDRIPIAHIENIPTGFDIGFFAKFENGKTEVFNLNHSGEALSFHEAYNQFIRSHTT